MKPVVMRTLLSLAVATALAGCSLAPTYERPQAPVDAAYPSGPAYGAPGQAAAGAPAAADVGWRDFFGDPLLQELLALSLANNRDLRVAALNVEAARLNPSGQAGISRSYQVGASLSTWELDLFGRIRSLSEQALQLYLAQDETRLATQLTLVAETANAYLTLRADQELLALTRQTLAAQQESYKLTRQSYDLGVATELDLSQAEISLRTAERNLSQYTRMAAQDRNALVLLVGQPLPAGIGAQLDQAVALPDGVVLADLPAGLPSDLLARRPDIRAAEHQLQAANASIGAARAAFFPRISLTGSAGTASASLGGLFDAGSGPGVSRRRSACRSSRAGRCAPAWTWPRSRRTSASRATSRPSRAGSARSPTRWPAAAHCRSRSGRRNCWCRPTSAPTTCRSSVTSRASTTISACWIRSVRCIRRSRRWSRRGWRACPT